MAEHIFFDDARGTALPRPYPRRTRRPRRRARLGLSSILIGCLISGGGVATTLAQGDPATKLETCTPVGRTAFDADGRPLICARIDGLGTVWIEPGSDTTADDGRPTDSTTTSSTTSSSTTTSSATPSTTTTSAPSSTSTTSAPSSTSTSTTTAAPPSSPSTTAATSTTTAPSTTTSAATRTSADSTSSSTTTTAPRPTTTTTRAPATTTTSTAGPLRSGVTPTTAPASISTTTSTTVVVRGQSVELPDELASTGPREIVIVVGLGLVAAGSALLVTSRPEPAGIETL